MTPTPVPPTATPLPVPGDAALQSVTVTLPETGPVTLQDGLFTQNGMQVALLMWGKGHLAPLDGQTDALAAFELRRNGNLPLVYLAAFENQDGKLVQRGDAILLDVYARVEKLAIWDAELVADVVVHWQDDPLDSPSKQVRMTWHETESGWQLWRLQERLDAGTARRIALLRVDLPENGSVPVYGIVDVMPFENNLVYRWLNPADGTVLDEGSFLATPQNPDEMGGPGYFDVTIPLPKDPPPALVLQVLEISMRDGSIIALDSVQVVIE
jgi:hypothetical protein